MKKVLAAVSPILISLAWSAGAQTLSVSPASVTLSALAGTNSAVSTPVTVSTSTGATVAYLAYNSNSANGWLQLASTTGGTPSGNPITVNAPGTLAIFANPSGLAAGPYTGTVVLAPQNGTSPINIQVNLVVSTIGVSPQPPVTFSYTVGSLAFPSAAPLQLTGASSSPNTQFTVTEPTTSNCSWMQVAPLSGTTPAFLSVALNQGVILSLTPNTYSCTFTITPTNSPNTPISVPAQLTVTAAPTITVNPSSILLGFQNGTTSFPSQTLTISSNGSSAVNYSLTPNFGSASNWFTLSKTSGTLTPPGNTDTVTVAYNGAALAPNTYSGQITLTANNAQQNIPVQLLVSNTALLNVAPSTVSFTSELYSSAPPPQTIEATVTSGTPNITINASTSQGGNWLFAQAGQTITTATAACSAPPCTPIVISVANISNLTLGTYKGTVAVYDAVNGALTVNSPVNVAVTLTIANDPLISTNVSTSASAPVIFATQTPGGAAPAAQTITVTSTSGATLTYAATFNNTTSTGCSNWLSLGGNTSGNTSGSFTATAVPTGISPTTSGPACTGNITITATNPATGNAAPNSPYVIPVAYYVSTNALLVVTPDTSPAFSAQLGQIGSVTSQNCGTNGTINCTLTLTNTSSSDPMNIVASASTTDNTGWLSAGITANSIPLNGSVTLTIGLFFIPSSPGSYSGAVTITATAGSGKAVLDSPLIIPVTLQVTSGTPTADKNSLSFTQTLGGATPATQTINVGSSSGAVLNVTAGATSSSTSPWLTVTPTSGQTPLALTVTANGSNLAASATPYTGQITITAAGSANVVNVPVSLTVNGGTIAADKTSLTFTQAAGGSAPAAQAINVTGTPGALNFTTSAATTTGGNWLTASPASGTTPGAVSVTASAGSLAVGTYQGTVTITSAGATGSPISIPVTLNVVTAQTLTVNPTTLNFTGILNQASPSAQTAQLTSSGSGTSFTAAASTSSGGNWLTVSPTSGVTPAQLTVSVSTQGMVAGNYTGTIAINSPNASSTTNLTVNLTVASIPTPVIGAVQNAAGYSVGGVAPGENIVIRGSGIGPATLTGPVYLNNNTALATTVANTQILFDGIPSPVIYVSATQSSVMVPYELAGRVTTNLQVVYQGVPSVAVPYNVLTVHPGIYTQNATGTGPGSILNQDFSVNGPGKPAAVGSVVAVYMTGEGVTSPASTTGAIAPIGCTNKPTATPVTATVGGLPATVNYYGCAPQEPYGVMQVNITIPAGVASGAQPVLITVGSAPTQTGVTVSVQATPSTEPEQ